METQIEYGDKLSADNHILSDCPQLYLVTVGAKKAAKLEESTRTPELAVSRYRQQAWRQSTRL